MSLRERLRQLRGTAGGPAPQPAIGGAAPPSQPDIALCTPESAPDTADALNVAVSREARAHGVRPSRASPRTFGPETLVPGTVRTTPFGACYVAEWRYPLDYAHGTTRLETTLAAPLAHATVLLARDPSARAHIQVADARRFVYLDTETTGLAGGTGTYAFLIGVGRFIGDEFVVQQLFMRTLAEEFAALHLLAEVLADCEVLVTYNGKAFDWPLLETRYTLARQGGPKAPGTPRAHVDLLFAARRLWRARLASCTLGRVEQALLGVRRADDTPGWLIPQLYFAYLRDSDARPLTGVFRHNALDLLSLAALLARVAWVEAGVAAGAVTHPFAARVGRIGTLQASSARLETGAGDEDGAPSFGATALGSGPCTPESGTGDARALEIPADEALALGRCCEEAGDLARALRCYELATQGQALVGELRSAIVREARTRAGLVLKRLHRTAEAIAYWEATLAEESQTRDAGSCDVRAHEELAKHAEHRLRDLAVARGYVLRALAALDASGVPGQSRIRARLLHRLRRLEMTLAARTGQR